MRQSKYITIITMACALFFASCSDEYMENMNTDPSKAATIDPNAQLTTAQLQTYGDLSMMEIYRNYHYAFTQQLMGCWNTTNYGGRHTLDNNEMSTIQPFLTFFHFIVKHREHPHFAALQPDKFICIENFSFTIQTGEVATILMVL